MEVDTSRTLLSDIISHLPEGVWFMLHERNIGDAGLASALQRSREEIEALLINTMVYKETPKQGTQFVKTQWEIYCQQHIDPSSIKVETKNKVVYVLNGEPIFDSPSIQEQNSRHLRKIKRTTELPGDIIDELIESHELYKKKKKANDDTKKKSKDGNAKKKAASVSHSANKTVHKSSNEKPKDGTVTTATDGKEKSLSDKVDDVCCDPGGKRDLSHIIQSSLDKSNVTDSIVSTQSGSERVHIDDTATKETKRVRYDRCQIRTNAAALLAPQYTNQSIQDIELMHWDTTGIKEVAKSQQCEDEKDARAMLIAINKGNPIRAATTLYRFLSCPSNKEVKDRKPTHPL